MFRYDYEEVESAGAEEMMEHLRKQFADSKFAGSSLKSTTSDSSFTKQGLFIKFTDGSRIIFRLSGTGSSGATVRLYVERYSKEESEYGLDAQDGLKPLIEVALSVSKLKEFTGREKPTVITVSHLHMYEAIADQTVTCRLYDG
jgi:phosphoglucomutase